MPEDGFQGLVDIMERLRSDKGCPWDREQTHSSLRPFLIEEAYEVLESIDGGNPDELREELGDLLLQVVFHAQIARENERFSIDDVIQGINDKLIRRHPHVFGDITIQTAEEQRTHWEKLKKQEGKSSVLDGVPTSLPALLRADRIQQKAASVGFDWDSINPVWDKVHEELQELKDAVASDDQRAVEEELGDLLFAIVNLSRFLRHNTEDALRAAVEKFMHRFRKLEQTMDSEGCDMRQASLEEMDAIWSRIKKDECV